MMDSFDEFMMIARTYLDSFDEFMMIARTYLDSFDSSTHGSYCCLMGTCTRIKVRLQEPEI